jgi:hypothetical protein
LILLFGSGVSPPQEVSDVSRLDVSAALLDARQSPLARADARPAGRVP